MADVKPNMLPTGWIIGIIVCAIAFLLLILVLIFLIKRNCGGRNKGKAEKICVIINNVYIENFDETFLQHNKIMFYVTVTIIMVHVIFNTMLEEFFDLALTH